MSQRLFAGAALPANAYMDRELSWLEFNRRVLHQAVDHRTPLLERARFLGIFRSNLDEFFMKRVGGLKRQVFAQVSSPLNKLAKIRETILPMLNQQAALLTEEILPELERNGIRLLEWKNLSNEEKLFSTRFFEKNIFPVLTPLAVDPGHPFPFISNLSTSLGVLLKRPDQGDDHLFARIKIPDVFPAWIQVSPESVGPTAHFVSLLDLTIQHLPALFPGMEIVEVMAFRITRNADIERDEEDADDLLE